MRSGGPTRSNIQVSTGELTHCLGRGGAGTLHCRGHGQEEHNSKGSLPVARKAHPRGTLDKHPLRSQPSYEREQMERIHYPRKGNEDNLLLSDNEGALQELGLKAHLFQILIPDAVGNAASSQTAVFLQKKRIRHSINS